MFGCVGWCGAFVGGLLIVVWGYGCCTASDGCFRMVFGLGLDGYFRFVLFWMWGCLLCGCVWWLARRFVSGLG